MFKRTKICSGLLLAFSTGAASSRSIGSARSGVLRRAALFTVPALTGAMFSLPALAQSAPADVDASAPQRVIVTGSMIARTNAETAEAVTIISAESLKDQGITSVEQALATISSNQSSITTATTVGSFSGGGSFASLRGLGGSRTLVLVDGQRLANNVVIGDSVDLNGIPFAAIDHIEVLREGASSVYGADAIAGVINFITKKDLKGGQINVEGSKAQNKGGGNAAADFTWGHGDIGSDGYNVMVAANYTHTKELKGYQRSFASGFNPALGLTNTNRPGTAPGLYYDASGNAYQVNGAGCPGNPYTTTYYGECDYEYSQAVDLIPDQKNVSGLLSFTKAFGQDHTLNFQYLVARSHVYAWGGPNEYSATMTAADDPTYFPTAANSTWIASENGAGATAVPPNLNGQITAVWTDPNNNRYNYDTNLEQRALFTFTGSDKGWDYTTSAGYSINHNVQGVTGGYPLLTALTLDDGNLSPLINPFGAQSAAGQSLLNSSYLGGDLGKGQLSMWTLTAQGSHELGDFFHAGRPATLAIGTDLRGEHISFNTTPLAATLYNVTYYPVLDPGIKGSRTEQAVFAEMNVPITKQLEMTVSDREDRYSDFGHTNNGKVSFLFQPSKLISFRGAASTGFRAPSLVDLFSPQTFGAGETISSPQCTAGTYNAVFTPATCGSQGLVLSGGNPKLKPERSDNFDLGIVLAPLPAWGITVDWYHVVLKNEIHALSSTTVYDNYATLGNLYHLNNAGGLTTAAEASTLCPEQQNSPNCGYIVSTTANSGGVMTSGVDLSTNYTLRSAQGTFKFGLEGTWITEYRLQSYAGAPWISTRGQWNEGNNVHVTWQHELTMDWMKGQWGAGLSEHYQSAYGDERPTADGSMRTVGASSIWNGYGSYKPIPALKLVFGVRNLFNTNPPFSNQTASNFQGGYNISLSDPTGRAYYAKATYDF
jgi:iron complex outermembrane receptor protein